MIDRDILIVLVLLRLDQINFAHRCSRIISIGMQPLMDGNNERDVLGNLQMRLIVLRQAT